MSPPFSLYTTGIVVAQDTVETLQSLINKAEAEPNAESLLTARLHEAMNPLTFQIQAACNAIAKLIARTTDDPSVQPNYEEPVTYADMHARLQQSRELLANVKEEVIVARQNAALGLPDGDGGVSNVPVHVWVTSFCMPNLMFHLVTTYSILRKEGLPLGKAQHLEFFEKTMGAAVMK